MVTARCMAGFDPGVSYDHSAFVRIYRVAGIKALNPDHDGRPVFVMVPKVWPPGTPLSEVVDEIVAMPGNYATLSLEVNGVGAMPAQEIRRRLGEKRQDEGKRRWNFIHTTAESKTTGYMGLLTMFERDQLLCPKDPTLLRQLRSLQMEQGARGLYRIEVPDAAVHDDVSDAAMLAACPWKPRRAKRMICELARFANPQLAPPEAELPPRYIGGDVIELGCGLRVYQRPPLQDVDGRGLWLPAKPRDLEPYWLGPYRIKLP